MCNRETIFVGDGLIALSSYADYAAAVKKAAAARHATFEPLSFAHNGKVAR